MKMKEETMMITESRHGCDLGPRSSHGGVLGVGDEDYRPVLAVPLVTEGQQTVIDREQPPHTVLLPVPQLQLRGACRREVRERWNCQEAVSCQRSSVRKRWNCVGRLWHH